jgi:hypothetical protein
MEVQLKRKFNMVSEQAPRDMPQSSVSVEKLWTHCSGSYKAKTKYHTVPTAKHPRLQVPLSPGKNSVKYTGLSLIIDLAAKCFNFILSVRLYSRGLERVWPLNTPATVYHHGFRGH